MWLFFESNVRIHLQWWSTSLHAACIRQIDHINWFNDFIYKHFEKKKTDLRHLKNLEDDLLQHQTPKCTNTLFTIQENDHFIYKSFVVNACSNCKLIYHSVVRMADIPVIYKAVDLKAFFLYSIWDRMHGENIVALQKAHAFYDRQINRFLEALTLLELASYI